MAVAIDLAEKAYLAGFVPLLGIVTAISLRNQNVSSSGDTQASSGTAFLPLMLTSVYCAIGLVWAYLRLGFVYIFKESSQSQAATVQ